MEWKLPALRPEEKITLRLRALYEQAGFQLYRMGSFEEYDLYMQNRPFLTGDDPITFTATDGRLMALKPDVTLSIVKNTPAFAQRKLYYTEQVYRRSRQSREYREISQIGLEYIGGEGFAAETEVLCLAAESLTVVGEAALDLSHIEYIEAMLAPFGMGEQREAARLALQSKSPHGMLAAAKAANLPAPTVERLCSLVELGGPFVKAFEQAKQLSQSVPGVNQPLQELYKLYTALQNNGTKATLRLDFSIRGDTDYYNGLLFQGFVRGIPKAVLAGGRYDNLLHRFEKPQGAVGFALTLDALGRTEQPNGFQSFAAGALSGGEDIPSADEVPQCAPPGKQAPKAGELLNVALPKGRLGNKVYKLFAQAGFSCEGILEESRRLVFEDMENRVRYLLVKPSDVDIYVERGAADIGVVGRDVLLEGGADVLELADLKLGICRLAVAGRPDFIEDPALPLRIATKYPVVARRYYAAQSRPVEIIKLHGSIELAPILGLADVIVDIVETGSTLAENNLAVLAEIEPSSARLIANRASWRFKGSIIRELTSRLAEMLE